MIDDQGTFRQFLSVCGYIFQITFDTEQVILELFNIDKLVMLRCLLNYDTYREKQELSGKIREFWKNSINQGLF